MTINQQTEMKLLNRRNLLKLGILTTTAGLINSKANAAQKAPQASANQPIQKYVAKDYSHLLGGNLKGFSDELLKAHFGLYQNYINKINDLEARIKGFDPNSQDTTNYRGWHLGQTAMLNGAVLHELYFGNLGSSDKEPKGTLKKMIDRDFGNVQNFIGHLKAVGKVAHGWSIAAFNYRSGKMSIYGLASHNQTVPAFTYPLLVLDVYEHAYMLDYGTNRGKYIDTFVINLDWKPVQERLERSLTMPAGETVTV
jgi:Fe-Mn family superoxide dismutase